MRKSNLLTFSAMACLASVMLTSCEERTGTTPDVPALDSNEISSTGTMSLEREIISVPSPAQIAVLIERANIPFDATLMNPLANASVYVTEPRKAMGLGVLGADLAYAANYESGQLNMDYFNAIGKLASDLQIIDHLDPKLVTSLNNNIGNKEELLRLNARFFQAGDNYMKESQRPDLAALVLLGGWVEALYISVKAGRANEDIIARVGEQKYAAASMTRLIGKITDPSLKAVQDQLALLNEEFKGLRAIYTYQKPINDSKEKITYLRGKTTVEVTAQQLAALEQAISNLRNLIIR